MDSNVPRGLCADRLQYSKRALTYEQDALIAFQGVLRRSYFVTYYGVTVTLAHSGMDADTGFALGQMWMKRPRWAMEKHLCTGDTGTCKRRRVFPTWCWASIEAEIYPDYYYGPQSIYQQYIEGYPVTFPHNEAQIKFWLASNGSKVPLRDYVWSNDPVIPPDPNRQLLVEGDLIRVQYVTRKGTYHRWYKLFGKWIYFQPDDDDYDRPKGPDVKDIQNESEDCVLVLIQWDESQRGRAKRFLLMVLRWIDDIHAERLGLLTQYRHEFPADGVDQLPRFRKQFILQ